MKKKIISLLTCALLILQAAACGGGSAASDSAAPQESTTTALEQEITGEITVSFYDTFMFNSFLEEAAAAFEAKYPGVKVNLEGYSEMPEIKTMEEDGMYIAMVTRDDDSQTQEDYISKIGTELMSGKGADVLTMDVIPYYKYAEAGMLVNLQEYMETDSGFNIEDYQTNIIDALTYKDGLYLFPLDFSFSFFAYDSSLFTEEQANALEDGAYFAYGQLTEFGLDPFEANNKGENPVYMFGIPGYVESGDNIYTELFEESYEDFIDIENKEVHFDDGRFAELLETALRYSDNGWIKEGISGRMEFDSSMLETQKDQQYLYKTKNNFDLLEQYREEEDGMHMMISTGGSEYGNEDNDEIAGLHAGPSGNIPFEYNQAYGINANSSNKQTAWAFIKFLAGEEMQNSPQLFLTGLPINNNARMEKARMMVTGEIFGNVAAAVGTGEGKRKNDGGSGGEAEASEGQEGGPVIRQKAAQPENAGTAPPEAEAAATENTAASPDTGLDETQQKLYDNYTTALKNFSGQLNTYRIKDNIIESIMQTEVKSFFNGSKTAQEVANILQSRVGLYLNE